MNDPIKLTSIIHISEEAKWNTEVAKYRFSHIFHSHAWAKTFAETYNHSPSLYTFSTKSDIITIPISSIKRPFLENLHVSMPYSDFAGPLSNKPITDTCLKHIPQKLDINSIDVRLDSQIANQSFPTHYATYRTELPTNKDELLSSLPSKSVRYPIRKSLKDGYSVIKAEQKDLSNFYSLICSTRKRHGVPTPPFKFYSNLFKNVIQKGHGSLLLAKNSNNRIVAGSLFLFHNNLAYYKYNASDHRYNVGNANHLLLWEGVVNSIQRGCSFIDLGRAADSNIGLVKFKKHWQARKIPLFYLTVKRNGSIYSPSPTQSKTHNAMTSLLKNSPTSFSKLLGKMLYKYFS